MEESIAYLREQFQLPRQDIRTYSPLALAYIGDGIYELYIRTIVVGRGNRQASKLHHAASRLVKAPTQALMAEALEAEFTPKEEAVYRRGRRTPNPTPPPRTPHGPVPEGHRLRGGDGVPVSDRTVYPDDRPDQNGIGGSG